MLSPSRSTGTAAQSSIASSRLASGVSAISRCRPPGRPTPPTSAMGRSKCSCWLGLLIPAAVQQPHVVQQAAVSVRRRPELLDEGGEQLHVIRVDLRQAREVLRIVPVVGEPVVIHGDAELGIGPASELPPQHEGRHARDVRLVREPLEVEHQSRVRTEIFRDPGGTLERRQLAVGGLVRRPQAPLDLSHRLQVLVHAGAVGRPHRPLQGGDVRGHVIEDAAVPAHLGAALGGGAAVAEEALEDHGRVPLGRKRGRGRSPGDRVEVGAVVAVVAVADHVAAVDGQLQRGQRRVAPERGGGDLVGRRPGPHVDPLRLHGMDPAQPAGARARVVAPAVVERLRLALREAAHDGDVVPERRERRQDGGEVEARPVADGLPVVDVRVHRHPVRDVDEPEPPGRRGRRPGQRRERRHHRVEQRQRHRRAQAPQHRPAGECLLRDDHSRAPSSDPVSRSRSRPRPTVPRRRRSSSPRASRSTGVPGRGGSSPRGSAGCRSGIRRPPPRGRSAGPPVRRRTSVPVRGRR